MHFDEESAENRELGGRKSFTANILLFVIETLRINLETIKLIYRDIHHNFGFLCQSKR